MRYKPTSNGNADNPNRCHVPSAMCEGALCQAALAFPMAQDAADDPWVCNKGDDLHSGATGADSGGYFEGFPALRWSIR
jgi:hypothetical protein